MKVVVSGGTGFIGSHLVRLLLKENHEVIVLSRSCELSPSCLLYSVVEGSDQFSLVKWNPSLVTDTLVEAIDGSDCIIHLAGTSILQRRWTAAFKKELVDSRIISSQVLVSAIEKCSSKPKSFISASGVSYYGDCGDQILQEDSAAGTDFLSALSVEWENAVSKAEEFGVRTCSARIGIVLGLDGGAIEQMYPLFKYRIGGHIGDGSNWYPWVHIDDCVGSLLYAASTDSMRGPFNNTAPNPVTMRDFCVQLGITTNRWSWAHAPYFAVRLVLGEVASVVVSSLRVTPKVLQDSGFTWKYSELPHALNDLLTTKNI